MRKGNGAFIAYYTQILERHSLTRPPRDGQRDTTGTEALHMNITVKVDDKQLQDFIGRIKDGTIQRSINTAIHKTGERVKRFVIDDVGEEYEGGAHWFGAAVQKPQNGNLQCVIPIKGSRGVIGQQFKTGGGAYNTGPGGAYGFTGSGRGRGYGKLRGKKAAKIRAKIVKGQTSQLPDTLPSYGGNPPFLYKGIAYTRRTRQRNPISRVVGIAVPQMVTNRARDKIERDIAKELEKNVMTELENNLF